MAAYCCSTITSKTADPENSVSARHGKNVRPSMPRTSPISGIATSAAGDSSFTLKVKYSEPPQSLISFAAAHRGVPFIAQIRHSRGVGLFVAIEDLVAGLPRDPEFPTVICSPSSRRATKRQRSSIIELSVHGIATRQSRRKVLPMCPVRSVTYLSGRTHNDLIFHESGIPVRQLA